MGATKTEIPHALGYDVATDLMMRLSDGVERAMIVGSVRRNKPIVHDIELLVEPKIEHVTTDLFGGTAEISVLDRFCDALRDAGALEPVLWGPRLKRFTFRDISCELFIMRPPSQWGMGSVIRTGPADFSHRLVTQRQYGGHLPNGWRVHDLGIHDETGKLIETPDEQSVFDALGMAFIQVEHRA